MIANVLSIAGSDPSGGAGIQADLKTFSALGAYGMAVITALTAQNTQGVRSFQTVDPAFVAEQIDAIFADVRVDAVKIGMVATAEIAAAIADRLRHHAVRNIVLDPVMVAKSGDHLLRDDAVAAMRDQLVPMARVITPNLPEAGVLARRTRASDACRHAASGARSASAWLGVGAAEGRASRGTGQHRSAVRRRRRSPNCPAAGSRRATRMAPAARSRPRSPRLLPRFDMVEAARRAKAYLTDAMAASDRLTVGSGHGPVHHFHALWTEDAVQMTQFSEAAWQRTARLREAIDALPFNTELAAGTIEPRAVPGIHRAGRAVSRRSIRASWRSPA